MAFCGSTGWLKCDSDRVQFGVNTSAMQEHVASERKLNEREMFIRLNKNMFLEGSGLKNWCLPLALQVLVDIGR